MKKIFVIIIGLFLIFTNINQIQACTNFLISKSASKDGSTMITYAADSHVLYGELYYTEAADWLPGDMLDVYEWDTGDYLGKIKQIPHTYSVVGNMNEFQVVIGETTYGGRKELRNKKGIVDYGSLIYITLQRAKTAREAIKIMGSLVADYGYYSSGESFSIGDPNEVWVMDLIGKGEGNKGAVWVARRVPEGYICAHANQARIRTFPLANGKTSITFKNIDKIFNKKVTTVYADDVISLARDKGWFSGKDKDFSFVDAYAPLRYGALRFCEARVYAMFNRVSPSLNLTMDYVKGVENAEPMPLWIKPDKKLSVHDLMELMRDHFEGTDFDMTKDVGAGPYKLPYRYRPLTWKVDSVTYCNERAISTQQTGFSFVAQCRSWLPNEIGGVNWFGVDDAYSTVYMPIYCGVQKIPHSIAVGTGDFNHFTWESAFWVFNWVSNYTYLRYNEMIIDVQKLQRKLEGNFLAMQPKVDNGALALYKQSPQLARDYLTDYSAKQVDKTVKSWRKLGEDLLVKYLDGNVKNEHGKVKHPGYEKSWYKNIIKQTGDHFKVKKLPGEGDGH